MSDPFTIRIFVPDGDPDGIRLIDRMNWTGLGLIFRRDDWSKVLNYSEMKQIGVYILVGYKDETDDLPTLYIGQADGIQTRINSHYKEKEFWEWAVVFVSSSGGLNRAHVTWLEYSLVERAIDAGRCHLDNSNSPQEPRLTRAEKADTQGFLKEILQMLPLAGLRAFQYPKAVHPSKKSFSSRQERDTIIVPANEDGFNEVFLGQDCWHAIRISGGMISKIRYIAAYQTNPISAITYYAPVKHIEPYGEEGKYKIVFSDKAKKIGPVVYGNAPKGAMQGPRYTSLVKLKDAVSLEDLVPWNKA